AAGSVSHGERGLDCAVENRPAHASKGLPDALCVPRDAATGAYGWIDIRFPARPGKVAARQPSDGAFGRGTEGGGAVGIAGWRGAVPRISLRRGGGQRGQRALPAAAVVVRPGTKATYAMIDTSRLTRKSGDYSFAP